MSQAAITPSAVENDASQRSQAMLAHLLGIFGILGTGIYYLVKKNDARTGEFVKTQIRESFNFQALAFCVFLAVGIVSGVLGAVSAILGIVLSFVSFVVMIAVLVLVIQNAMKANKGENATYKFKLPILK